MEIRNLLEQLAEARHNAEILRMDKQTAIDSAIPDEVRNALRDIDLEYEGKEQHLHERIFELESQVKMAVTQHGESVKHSGLNAVFSGGRVSWDSKALDGYALNHPELFAFRKEGKPSVSIRAVKF